MIDWLRTVLSRIPAPGRRGRLEDDLRDELDFHLSMREAQMRDAGARDARCGARRLVVRTALRQLAIGLPLGWPERWPSDRSSAASSKARARRIR